METKRKLVEETIVSTNLYLEKAIPQLRALADEFYQQPGEKTWLKLVDLFEGIQWILETVMKIDGVNGLEQMVSNYEVWNKYVQSVSELNGVIKEIETSMINQDSVLIGDILLYEIVPIFEKMLSELKFLNGQGVNGNVS